MQNMLLLFNLLIAKIIPHPIAAGKAGGTVIVIKSSEWSINEDAGYPYLIIIGNVAQKPMTARDAIRNTNFIESL